MKKFKETLYVCKCNKHPSLVCDETGREVSKALICTFGGREYKLKECADDEGNWIQKYICQDYEIIKDVIE